MPLLFCFNCSCLLVFQGTTATTYLALEINPAGLRVIDYDLCASRIFTSINNVTSEVASIETLSSKSGCPSAALQVNTNNYDIRKYLCHSASVARVNSERYLCGKCNVCNR